MKEENQNRWGIIKKNKILLLIIVFFLIITITIGITYAFWRIDEVQQRKNVINTECLKITFEEKNEGVNLLEAYPISDEEGLKGEPYTFTITNTCENSWASYQINLETLNSSILNEKYLKASLSVGEENKIITKLTEDLKVEKTLENATKAYKLLEGELYPKQEITYDLRLWMDSEVTAEETDSMDARYESKVTIQFSYIEGKNYLLDFDDFTRLASIDESICPITDIVSVKHMKATIAENDEYAELGLEFADVEKNLKQTEYRYCGRNPYNYVTFNNEVAGWRIIGLVNTPEGQRIKLIRANPLDEPKAWNDSNINDWTNASLKKYLNENYLNSLDEEARGMIDTITWNLGGSFGNAYGGLNQNITTQFYNYERGTDNPYYSYSKRPKVWKGQIGLIYPSDYGYATSGESTLNRELCLKSPLVNWSDTPYKEDCVYNDWLFSHSTQWTLTPNHEDTFAFDIRSDGMLGGLTVATPFEILPVLYLKSDVQIAGGTGRRSSPYILEQ